MRVPPVVLWLIFVLQNFEISILCVQIKVNIHRCFGHFFVFSFHVKRNHFETIYGALLSSNFVKKGRNRKAPAEREMMKCIYNNTPYEGCFA